MIRFTVITLLALGGVARAECPPSVALSGDPALVTAIARELDTRGIGIASDRCPSLRANVAWRGAELVIVIDDSTERSVNEIGTAATVIESFARTDVAMPLLAARSIAPIPHLEQSAVARNPRQTLDLSASFESSVADDGTTWLGASLKLRIETGPIFAAARYRSSKVVDGLSSPRGLNELLIGVDVPIALGRLLLAPGFAGGLGGMETRVADMKRETGGFLAETHVSLSVPVVGKLALDVSLGAGLVDFDGSVVMGPAEPSLLLRAGVGLRYGR